MRSDINDLKNLTLELLQNGKVRESSQHLINKIYGSNLDEFEYEREHEIIQPQHKPAYQPEQDYLDAETIEEEEILKLEQKEIEMIKKALEKNKGKRKAAADQLGISERTLYRKIKQFDL